MKIFLNILLAAYVAFVACYPCNDKDICVDDQQTLVEVSIANHEHSPDEIDLCSPFCICNCCSSTINQPKYYFFTFYFSEHTDKNSVVKPHAVASVSHAIWQPPRVA